MTKGEGRGPWLAWVRRKDWKKALATSPVIPHFFMGPVPLLNLSWANERSFLFFRSSSLSFASLLRQGSRSFPTTD